MTTSPATPESVLGFWFDVDLDDAAAVAARVGTWFAVDAAFDDRVRERFGPLLEAARAGRLAHWSETPRSSLALVVVLDQFPRNIHRGSAEAFACDALALAEASAGIERGHDAALHPVEAVFYYMPLQHAEDRAVQERSCALTEALASSAPPALRGLVENCAAYARTHRDIVARFGRFPHRNQVLARESSAEERAWLEAGGETFGQSA